MAKKGIFSIRKKCLAFASFLILFLSFDFFESNRLLSATLPVVEVVVTPANYDDDSSYLDEIMATNSSFSSPYPFPRWNSTLGIPIQPLIDYSLGLLNNASTVVGGKKFAATSLYIIDDNWTIWKSTGEILNARDNWKRSSQSERLSLHALYLLQSLVEEGNTTHPWKALVGAIQRGGFPFLAYYKDFSGCNENNWKENNGKSYSIPIFTLCARLDCNYSFPWPTYESIGLAKFKTEEWEESFVQQREVYAKKINQAVWRGSLTGTFNKELKQSLRWKLCRMAKNNSLLDARLVSIPKWRTDANLSEVDGLAPKMNMEDYQQYVAVIDIDGNAWSSRFGALLCMDSVVLKVQPKTVDYFHHHLVPWKHYIPIQETLSDMTDRIKWVIEHKKEARAIVENAQHWCSRQMRKESLAKDVLNIWNIYVEYLDKADQTWSKTWSKATWQYFQPINAMTDVENLFVPIPIEEQNNE